VNGWHVALLRGINVGTAKRLAMADLRRIVTSLGFGDVATLLNSGNVVFTASPATGRTAAARIERAIEQECGFTSRVTVLTAAEWSDIVRDNPLLSVGDHPSRLMVSVLADAADMGRLDALQATSWAPEALAFGTRVIYSWYPNGIAHSPLGAAIAKRLGDAVTTRNWGTTLKLHALMAAD
jgi:uncharacterized protein (DUF1697 family)